MRWKAIGDSVTGSSHTQTNRPCEDAISFGIVDISKTNQVLVCCISDGAGSAKHAAAASAYVTSKTIDILTEKLLAEPIISEEDIYLIAEELYEGLTLMAQDLQDPVYEFSCTWLGAIIYENRAIFFQVGDGVVIRSDKTGYYSHIWWPDNGEYQNSTCFLIDDKHLGNLRITVIDEQINEIALLTDGLQLLALSVENQNVHQPFFTALYKVLRMADDEEKLSTLNTRLAEYLDSSMINNRTDDDKTLFLATRLTNEI